MYKRLYLFLSVCVVSMSVCAQWSPNDSIKLRRILESEGEIKLNNRAKDLINFGSPSNKPLTLDERPGLQYDESLPAALPDRKPLFMTLRPYKPGTKYNYDPIYSKSIQVEMAKEQAPASLENVQFVYKNWAKNWRDAQFRRTLEQIEATGVKRMMGVERANNMAVPSYVILPGGGNDVPLGGGHGMVTTASGASIGGFDFMAPFTREFWNKKGRDRRARTLEVLKNYGDSTTIHLNYEIIR